MSTIDGISSRISDKIKIINDIISIMSGSGVKLSERDLFFYDKTINNFEFGSLQILSDYYFLDENSADYLKKKAQAYAKYTRFVLQENIISQLNFMFGYLKNIITKMQIRSADLKKLLYKYEEIKLKVTAHESRGIVCHYCEEPMSFISRESILECPRCFAQKDAKGMQLSEDQSNVTDKNYKSNQYQTRRHGKMWLDSIQGLETKEIPEFVIQHVKNCMRKDRVIDPTQITCETIRSYLSKSLKASKYNQHIPKIRKLVTGIEPPQLTEQETDLFYEYFGKIINIYNTKKTKVNCPYCPYFIYKILEHILRDPSHAERRKRFFSYIHLQLPNTLHEQDKIWEMICEEIPEFIYKPTIRQL